MFQEIVGSSAKQYCTRFPYGTTIFFRLLTIKEFNRASAIKDYLELADIAFYEQVYNYCVYPAFKDLGGQVRAGVLASVGEFIFWASSSTESIENDIEMARYKAISSGAESFYNEMKEVVMLAFPSYTPDELDNKDRLELTQLFTRAESMMRLKTQGEYKPINVKTLRKAPKTSKIDFEKENKDLMKQGYNNNQVNQPSPQGVDGHKLKEIRQRAATRATKKA